MSYYPSARTRGRGCRPKVNICMYREYKGEGVLSVHILWMTSSSLVYSTSYLMYFKHVIFFIAELRGKFCPLFFGKQNYHIYIYIYVYKYMQDHFLKFKETFQMHQHFVYILLELSRQSPIVTFLHLGILIGNLLMVKTFTTYMSK